MELCCGMLPSKTLVAGSLNVSGCVCTGKCYKTEIEELNWNKTEENEVDPDLDYFICFQWIHNQSFS
jgi:hypothetical protein